MLTEFVKLCFEFWDKHIVIGSLAVFLAMVLVEGLFDSLAVMVGRQCVSCRAARPEKRTTSSSMESLHSSRKEADPQNPIPTPLYDDAIIALSRAERLLVERGTSPAHPVLRNARRVLHAAGWHTITGYDPAQGPSHTVTLSCSDGGAIYGDRYEPKPGTAEAWKKSPSAGAALGHFNYTTAERQAPEDSIRSAAPTIRRLSVDPPGDNPHLTPSQREAIDRIADEDSSRLNLKKE